MSESIWGDKEQDLPTEEAEPETRGYSVNYTITGYASVYVEAVNEDEARDKAAAGDGDIQLNDWELSRIVDVEVNE